MTTWKRGDRVYLKHAPDIAGEVRESEDGVVVVISDVCHQRLYVTAEDLEWFTATGFTKHIEITQRNRALTTDDWRPSIRRRPKPRA